VFEFGANWRRFLAVVDEHRINLAVLSLRSMLAVQDLRGRSFLDIGSGSGLFSLAASRLGARVHSFDYDPESVACALELRRRHSAGDEVWNIEPGSVLDDEYLSRLATFDVVYSWGVLHHTGDMMRALENAVQRVAPNGTLFVALYNDQGWISHYWLAVKRCYVQVPSLRWLLIALHAPYLVGLRWLVRLATGRLAVERGMSLWHDMRDWVGGYPFEVMRPDAMLAFLRERGFVLTAMKTCGGRHGCNEFIARRESPSTGPNGDAREMSVDET
jgi:2-polyprenyl-6-hydroxyphenyl methylase/3-demethylubiquinone-9 3-methyltransferase